MGKKVVKNIVPDKKTAVKTVKKKALNIPWWASVIIIITACFALYYPVINYGLVECDDHEIIHRDYERINQIGNWEQEFSKSYMYNSYYRPLVTISLMLNAKMSEQEPTSYHLTNIIIHIVNACLVFSLLVLLGYKRFLPLIGGLIYAVHPVFTNAVAWIVGRNDLMLSMFFLLSFIFLVQYIKKQKWYFLVIHFLSFMLALFSKETAVFASLIFAAYIFVIEKNRLRDKTTITAGVSWFLGIAIWFIFHSMAELGEPVYESGFDIIIKNIRVLPEFIAKFVIPAHLSVLPTYSLFNTALGVAILLIFIFTFIKIKTNNYNRILFGAIWFLVIIVPGMFMALLNAHEWNEYLECRGYLAMFGLLIIIFDLLKNYIENNEKIFIVLSVVLIMVLAYLTVEEKQNYQDAIHYYESAVEDDGTRANFQFLSGQIYLNNLFKKTNNIQYLYKAESYIKTAMSLRPGHASYYRSLAAVYTNMSRHDMALPLLEKSLDLDSNRMDTYNGLGYTYYYLGRFGDEVNILSRALKKWPDNQDIIYNLAVAYFAMYNSDSALSLVRYSFNLDKGEKNLYELYHLMNNWGGTFIQNKYYGQGVSVLRIAAEIEPKRYAAYENLMNYYLLVYNRPDSAAFFAKKLIERGRKIAPNKLEFLKPYMK
ncbi:MAG: hypothetical protein V1779_08110 [bacterium]